MLTFPLLSFGEFFTFVTTAENSRFSAAFFKLSGKELDHGSFPRPPHGDVAYANHLSSQIRLFFNATTIASKPKAHGQTKSARQNPEQHPQHGGTKPSGPTKNHFGAPLFKFLDGFFHPWPSYILETSNFKLQTSPHEQTRRPQH